MGGRKEEEQVCGRPSSCLPQDTCGPGAIQSPGHHSPSWGPCVTVQAPHLPRAPCSGPQGEPGKGSEPRQTAWSLMLIGLTDRKTGGQTTDDHPSLWPTPAISPVSSESPYPVRAEKQVGHASAWPRSACSGPGVPGRGLLWGRPARSPPAPWVPAAHWPQRQAGSNG